MLFAEFPWCHADKEVPNTMAFENSQPQPGAVYAADQSSYGAVDASQNYYQVVLCCISSIFISGCTCLLPAQSAALQY